jgi:hypothetical protein
MCCSHEGNIGTEHGIRLPDLAQEEARIVGKHLAQSSQHDVAEQCVREAAYQSSVLISWRRQSDQHSIH